MFGLSGVSGWLAGRVGRVPMIFAGALIQVLAAIMMPLSTELPVLLLSLFLLGLGWNFSYIAGSSLLSAALEGSQQRGRVQGINEAMVAIASAVGSLGTGGVYSISGVVAVAFSGVVFSVTLGALALWLGRAHLFPSLHNAARGGTKGDLRKQAGKDVHYSSTCDYTIPDPQKFLIR